MYIYIYLFCKNISITTKIIGFCVRIVWESKESGAPKNHEHNQNYRYISFKKNMKFGEIRYTKFNFTYIQKNLNIFFNYIVENKFCIYTKFVYFTNFNYIVKVCIYTKFCLKRSSWKEWWCEYERHIIPSWVACRTFSRMTASRKEEKCSSYEHISYIDCLMDNMENWLFGGREHMRGFGEGAHAVSP